VSESALITLVAQDVPVGNAIQNAFSSIPALQHVRNLITVSQDRMYGLLLLPLRLPLSNGIRLSIREDNYRVLNMVLASAMGLPLALTSAQQQDAHRDTNHATQIAIQTHVESHVSILACVTIHAIQTARGLIGACVTRLV
jgi:hypothetical protein